MKFSLIIGTLNRKNSLELCLQSIMNQTYQNFEIIIIDQSNNDETEYFISLLNSNKIIYKHVNFKGLSKSRNYALSLSSGEYFCLIDDDAYYEEDYLEKACSYVNSFTIISGFIFDTEKSKQFANYKNEFDKKKLGLRTILKTCPSAGLVFPASVFKDVGGFDEQFGVGSIYCAAEESDLILRARKKGYCVVYHEDMKLKHPVPIKNRNDVNYDKLCSYYFGIGALLKKHNKHIVIVLYKYEILLKLFIKIIFLKKDNSVYFKKMLDSFVLGYKKY